MKNLLKISIASILLISTVKEGVAQTWWSGNTLGTYGTAFGYSNTVNGSRAFAAGAYNNSSGQSSFSFGENNTASGFESIAAGYDNTASSTGAIALGFQSQATGALGSFAVGWGSKAQGTSSFAGGRNALASGAYSISLGYNSIASYNYATAIGYGAKAQYTYATAIGYYTLVSGQFGLALGNYAESISNNSLAIGNYVKTSNTFAMTIGSGVNSTTKLDNNITNTLMVGFNSDIPTFFVGASAGAGTTGNVGIGTSSPDYKLDVEGNLSMNKNTIYLLDGTDVNHGLGWYGTNKLFAGQNIDGPVLFGFAGGALSTTQNGESNALTWNKDGEVKINTNTGGAVLNIGGSTIVSHFNYGINEDTYIRPGSSAGNVYMDEGSVGIGTTNTQGYKLAIKGSVIAESVCVKLYANWPDFVFTNNYGLMSLADVEDYIKENKHLPNVPSEAEVSKDGINLGEMDAILLQKIEELTLYIIEQQKQLNKQNKLIEKLAKAN